MTAKEFTEAAIAVFLERGGEVTPDITLDLMKFIEHDDALLADYHALAEENDYVNHIIGKTVKKFFSLENDKVITLDGQCSLLKNYTRFLPKKTIMDAVPWERPIEYRNPTAKKAIKLLENAGQIILQGAPGCGKTFITKELAVCLCFGPRPYGKADDKIYRRVLNEEYKELERKGRISFVTFHQSLDYEEFVEGYKPIKNEDRGELEFIVKSGIFKRICKKARDDAFRDPAALVQKYIEQEEHHFVEVTLYGERKICSLKFDEEGNFLIYREFRPIRLEDEQPILSFSKSEIIDNFFNKEVDDVKKQIIDDIKKGHVGRPHVLIIDEINRANISKVLGELITLIEKTKRIGAEDEFCVTLPYSGERFGVPQNLYIIGTMNTADRSLGYIDYAIRRRFAFLPLKSEWAVVREFYGDRGELMNRQHELYTRIRNLVKDHLNEDFLLDDVMIGHSYFLAATEEDYKLNLDYKIRPLLEEYLRDGILVEDGTVKDTIKNLR